MNVGDTVYLRWYDFRTGAENVHTGTVVDNSLWEGTKWQDYVNVQFQPVGLKGPICHHFLPDKLSTVNDNVPHDDCYLTCGEISEKAKKISTIEVNVSNMQAKISSDDVLPSDDRAQLEAFKQENWDHQHNYLRVDKLDEFYQLWRMFMVSFGYVEAKPAKRIVSDGQMAELKERLTAQLEQEAKPQADVKPQPVKRKKKKSKTNVTQLSLF